MIIGCTHGLARPAWGFGGGGGAASLRLGANIAARGFSRVLCGIEDKHLTASKV